SRSPYPSNSSECLYSKVLMAIKSIFHSQRLESDSAAKNCCMREWNTGITAVISTSVTFNV
ncbi:hypothetical protein ON021_02065, partial [Microcoleus sp. HI-ES]|nr:hypothetical protein [Microcoleus sp. HI-ES]